MQHLVRRIDLSCKVKALTKLSDSTDSQESTRIVHYRSHKGRQLSTKILPVSESEGLCRSLLAGDDFSPTSTILSSPSPPASFSSPPAAHQPELIPSTHRLSLSSSSPPALPVLPNHHSSPKLPPSPLTSLLLHRPTTLIPPHSSTPPLVPSPPIQDSSISTHTHTHTTQPVGVMPGSKRSGILVIASECL